MMQLYALSISTDLQDPGQEVPRLGSAEYIAPCSPKSTKLFRAALNVPLGPSGSLTSTTFSPRIGGQGPGGLQESLGWVRKQSSK